MGKEDSQSQKVKRQKLCVYNVNMLQKDKHHVDKLKVFNCLYTKADSLPNKMDELKARIQCCEGSMDIIGITEINPKNCRYYPGKAELQIDGYDFMDDDFMDGLWTLWMDLWMKTMK